MKSDIQRKCYTHWSFWLFNCNITWWLFIIICSENLEISLLVKYLTLTARLTIVVIALESSFLQTILHVWLVIVSVRFFTAQSMLTHSSMCKCKQKFLPYVLYCFKMTWWLKLLPCNNSRVPLRDNNAMPRYLFPLVYCVFYYQFVIDKMC